jgi:hypothetical protein
MDERNYQIIQSVKAYCADLLEQDREPLWTREDAEHIAGLFNQASEPWVLFVFVDEKTGSTDVGYRTKDGREWFPILRQMRNQTGSGLFEKMERRPLVGGTVDPSVIRRMSDDELAAKSGVGQTLLDLDPWRAMRSLRHARIEQVRGAREGDSCLRVMAAARPTRRRGSRST